MRSWLNSLAAELLPHWMSDKAASQAGVMQNSGPRGAGRGPANGHKKAGDHDDTPHDYAFPELEGDDEQEALRQAGNLKD